MGLITINATMILKKAIAIIDGYVQIQTGNETAVAEAVAYVGPVTVAIDASHSSFQLYQSGIYYESKCSQVQIDHDMLAVGYSYNRDSKYWIVQNSWGASWGMQGYILMSKDKNNNCGIASYSAYPSVGTDTFKPDDTCYGK